MPGNELAGVLDAETPLHRGLKEIAKLGSNRERRAQQQQRACFAETRRHKPCGDDKARYKAADGASPGLFGTDPWPELRSANAAAREKPADVVYPDDQQDEHQRGESPDRVEPHRDRGDERRERIATAKCGPAATMR